VSGIPPATRASTHRDLLVQPYIFPPIVLFLETEDLADLAIGKQPFEFADLAREGNIWIELPGQFARRRVGRYRVVRGVEYREAETILLNAKLHDLAEVTGIDIAPGDPFADLRMGK
jgi:hypothetical protein